MLHGHVASETTTTDTDEGDTIAMARIHVGLQLENKATEILSKRIDHSVTARTTNRSLSKLQKRIEKWAYTKVGHGRSKKDRCQITGMHRL